VKRLYQKIQIDDISFTEDIRCEIIKSRNNFTQTCVITFPNILYKKTNQAAGIDNEAQNLTALIKVNDIVKVWSGYNKPFNDLPIKFNGFISRIEVKENVVIHCEDYGYVLKQINVPSKAFTNATIKDIVEYSLQGANITVEYDNESLVIGDWVIDNNSNINSIQVLEKLNKYGIRVYFIESVLRIGGLTDTANNTQNFIFEHNIVQDNLIYRQDDQLNVCIKGISNLESNEKIVRYAYLKGDSVVLSDNPVPGEQITLNYYNKTADKLDEELTNNFNKYIYKGFVGSFTTFLEPLTEVNDTINLFSLKYPERNGAYKCKSVVTRTGTDGGYQEIELDYKIASFNVV